MKRSTEPFWWALFGAGGVLSAMFIPAMLLITGIAIPLGWIDPPPYDALMKLVDNIIARLLLTAIISFSLFHWAHRFRFTLYDGLQVKHLDTMIAVICYGTAIIGTLAAVYFVLI